MQFGKRIGPLARRVAAMQIPVYAGNASFFLLLSVFPVVSLLLSLLPYTPLTLDHLLAFCEEFAPDWTLRALEFFVRTLYASSSAAIISASAVLTLWSASKGMLSLLYGLDAVAEVRETRGYVQRRLLCVLYTVGMLLALLLTLGLYVGGQALLRFLTGRGFSLAAVLEPVLRHLHLVSLVLLTALFTGIFLALPDKRQRFVHVLVPGHQVLDELAEFHHIFIDMRLDFHNLLIQAVVAVAPMSPVDLLNGQAKIFIGDDLLVNSNSFHQG